MNKVLSKLSVPQTRIENFPEKMEEFQLFERAFSGTHVHFSIPREYEEPALSRFNYLDKLLGFEGESQMRKKGV